MSTGANPDLDQIVRTIFRASWSVRLHQALFSKTEISVVTHDYMIEQPDAKQGKRAVQGPAIFDVAETGVIDLAWVVMRHNDHGRVVTCRKVDYIAHIKPTGHRAGVRKNYRLFMRAQIIKKMELHLLDRQAVRHRCGCPARPRITST